MLSCTQPYSHTVVSSELLQGADSATCGEISLSTYRSSSGFEDPEHSGTHNGYVDLEGF